MYFFGGVDHTLRRAAKPKLVGGQLDFARHGQAHQVGGGSSASQAAAGAVASDGLGKPLHYRSLDGDGGRAGTPGGDILVKRADQQVGDGAHRLARAEYVSEETAILIAGVTYKIPQISEGVFTKTVLGQVRRSEEHTSELQSQFH